MKNSMVVGALTVFLLCIFLNATPAFSYPLIPEPDFTQGELCSTDNPDFSKFRYEEHIPYCKRNVSKSRRDDIYEAYHIPVECRRRFTIDHFIPLSIGGDNSDSNLWPEHVLVKATRPQLETNLYLDLKEGRLTQDEAIDIIIKEKTSLKQSVLDASFKKGCDTPSSF